MSLGYDPGVASVGMNMGKVKVALPSDQAAALAAPPAATRDRAPGLTPGHLVPMASGLAALPAGVREPPGEAR